VGDSSLLTALAIAGCRPSRWVLGLPLEIPQPLVGGFLCSPFSKWLVVLVDTVLRCLVSYIVRQIRCTPSRTGGER
jgi:hypothetical protein